MIGPALDNDGRSAFLFETVDGTLLAVSLDRRGANLPRDGGEQWIMQTEFKLGVHEAVPAAIDPEPILRGIRANGFFVWPARRTQPFGTAQ
jgi:hypothetical protein